MELFYRKCSREFTVIRQYDSIKGLNAHIFYFTFLSTSTPNFKAWEVRALYSRYWRIFAVMAIHVLTQQASAAGPLLAALRDRTLQQDSDRFRANLRRLGMMTAYEISKNLAYTQSSVETPLGVAPVQRLQQQPVVACLLRAALPFYDGFLQVFPHAESAFLGTYRARHREDNSFDIATDYLASDDLTGKDLILTDPMLATGKSLVRNYEAMLRHGKPRSLTVACVVAAEPGIAYLQEALPEADIWAVAIDPALNGHYYIVPGLGDAGDLAFGLKL